MSFVLRPPEETIPLNQTIRGIGRNRRTALVLTGVLVFFSAIGLLVVTVIWLDVLYHLDRGIRALSLFALLATGGVIVYRKILAPSQLSTSPIEVAQFIESRHPEFNDALASAISFQEQTDHPSTNSAFRHAAIRRAERITNRVEISGVIPSGQLFRAAAGSAIVLILIFASLISLGSKSGTALTRIMDPFGAHPWPPRTTIEILEPARSITLLAKGSAFPLSFEVRGEIPPAAILSIRLAGSTALSEAIPLESPEGDRMRVDHQLQPDRITRDFDYRIEARDADTGWKSVTVADPPRLTLLNGRPSPQIRLTYQPYTEEPPTELSEGAGAVEAIAGTRISLRTATDRPIVKAFLRYDGDTNTVEMVRAVGPLVPGHPVLTAAYPTVSEEFLRDRTVDVRGPNRNELAIDFDILVPGLYSLNFTDELGLTGVKKLDLRSFPDPAPVVTLLRPSAILDSLDLIPTSNVTIQARADDKTFALRKLALEYRFNQSPFRTLDLVDAQPAEWALPATAGTMAMKTHRRPTDLALLRTVPLSALRDPNGAPPKDGTILTIRSSATDWDDYTLAKQPGTSAEVVIRVRSPESLQADLQKKLAALRPEIERAQNIQADATKKLSDVKNELTQNDKKPNELRERIEGIQQTENVIRGIVSDPRDGIRAKAEAIRSIAESNQLTDTPVFRRADSVTRILNETEQRNFSQLDPLFDQTKRALSADDRGNPRSVQDPLAKAIRQQNEISDQLKAVAEELEQWAATAEIRGDARQLRDQIDSQSAESQALARQLPTGASPDRLSERERNSLEKLGGELNRLAEQAGKMISKADRVAAQRRADAAQARATAEAKSREAEEFKRKAQSSEANSPEQQGAAARAAARQAEAAQFQEVARQAEKEAAALENAARDAGRQAIADDLRQAAEAQRTNRSATAQAKLQEAMKRLDGMVDDLVEKKDQVDELAKKRKAAGDRVEQFSDRQDELAKKAKKASENPDAAAQAAEFKNLAAEQELLRRETEQLSRKLDRDGSSDAAEQLRRAAREMEQSRDELAEGRDPQANPNEALERLEDAKKQLEQEQPKQPDQLNREQQEQFTLQFKTFLEKQHAAIAESERLTKAAIDAKKWGRPLQASLDSLGKGQTSLAKEVRQFADSKTKEFKVFDSLLRQAADLMERAGTRIAERKADILLSDPDFFDPESEQAADDTARRPMEFARRRLEQIVQALAEEAKKNETAQAQPMPQPMQQPQEGQPGGAKPAQSSIPPIAELKALRNWQNEVNERTAEFAKNHPDRTKLTDDDKDELLEIEHMQKEISKLLEELLPQIAAPMGGLAP